VQKIQTLFTEKGPGEESVGNFREVHGKRWYTKMLEAGVTGSPIKS